MNRSSRRAQFRTLVAIVATCLLAPTVQARPLEQRGGDDFHTRIEPLLAYHCYECHGPSSREGGLRLSNARDAFRPGDFGIPVITPGSAELSPLMDMVTSDDLEDRMPKDRPALSADEIEILRQWIDRGAIWPESANAGSGHWAYRPPMRPEVPEIETTDGTSLNPVDAFVRERLQSEGLQPARRAQPAALARRLHFDLTGLPPSPEVVERFVANPSSQAWEVLVDELFDSPHFGEHWAVPWLDLARYADSTGFMSEVMISNWPYRDWVVDAINDDMPFDQFSIEQIAGDLLAEATPAQKVATGFHRAAPLNLEAGVREEESRITQVIDRANTTATVWLGSTISCAQCHDHKFDPISQEEYFRLLAFFNNTALEARSKDEMGGVFLIPQGPQIELPQSDRVRARAIAIGEALEAEVRASRAQASPPRDPLPDSAWTSLQKEIAQDRYNDVLEDLTRVIVDNNTRGWWPDPSKPSRTEWQQRARDEILTNPPRWKPVQPLPPAAGSRNRYTIAGEGVISVGRDSADFRKYRVLFETTATSISAIRLTTLAPENPETSPLAPVLKVSEIGLSSSGGTIPAGFSHAHAYRAWESGRAEFTIDKNPETSWFVLGEGSRRRDQSITLVLTEPLSVTPGEKLILSISIRETPEKIPPQNRRFRIETTSASSEIVALSPQVREAILEKDSAALSWLERRGLASLVRSLSEPDLDSIFTAARAALRRLPAAPVAHILVEEQPPRETRIFERGDPHLPGKVVQPGTPAILHAFPEAGTQDRLQLARWLMQEENPLTARVTVNRWWGKVFGRPLVDTPDDFGIRGSRPSHPELLDWLATELIASGWSRKALLRQMVLSETYQQSLIPEDPAQLSEDPENRFLARSTRLRLNAETVRDNALQIAGLLSPKIGGAPASPPQPPGLWRPNGVSPAVYVPSEGNEAYRRGLYTIARRSSPYPSLLNFDAGDRTTCKVERRITNTPLQALTTLNDEVFSEAALFFARRILEEKPEANHSERLEYAFLTALSRKPDAEEIEIFSRILNETPDSTSPGFPELSSLMAPSRFEMPQDADAAAFARWFTVSRILLNLDETIHRG